MEILQCEDIQEFVNIPKLELHAHLNGSLSQNTLKRLINLKKAKYPTDAKLDISSIDIETKDLSGCFDKFSLIHTLTDNLEAVYMATCDVIKEFCCDGVHYLELRTTPREVGNCMNQESYVENVLKAIKETEAELDGKIIVKLLLSIDRKRDINFAQETIRLAEKYFTSTQTVVGIDLSGHPMVGHLSNFAPLLEYSKRIGLKLAIHTSEVSGADGEVQQVLKLHPDRLGHGTFLHPDKGGSVENFLTLKELKIPLEICLTSNVICKTVPSYPDHHFKLFREMNYPCILCTDDKGVFNTSLSNEYYLASHYYSLTKEDLFDLSYNSINYIFSTNSDKDKLRKMWKQTDKFDFGIS